MHTITAIGRAMLNPIPLTYDYTPPMLPFLSIIYEDDHILVFDKPSGLLSVPGKDPSLNDSLQSRVVSLYPGAGSVHRLDKDTSGIILMAKHKKAHANLGMQFEKRQTRKTYFARVWGDMIENSGLVDMPLCVDWDNKPRQMVDYENGRPSQSMWEVVSRESGITRVKLTPITGRTHQLRVHMRAIGHPIIGDPFYATDDALAAAPRLQLHAAHLGLKHPETGEDMDFFAPLPF